MTEHIDDDALVALALADVEPEERDRLSAHLDVCPPCHSAYTDVEDGVRLTLAAAPPLAPPAGFSGRVLAAMNLDADQPGAGVPSRMGVPSRGGVRFGAGRGAVPTGPNPRAGADGGWPVRPALPVGASAGPGAGVWPLVAAAAAGLLLGALVTWVALVPGGIGAPPPASPNPRPASALVTGTGERVGSVDRTALEAGDVLVITVQARPGASYECVLVVGDGSRVSGGVWTLGDYGPGSAIWVVPTGGATVRGVELVAPSGTVWSRAEL